MHLESSGGGAGNRTPLACTPWAWLVQTQRTKRTLGEFATSFLYKELTFQRVANRWVLNIWRERISIKIKIFL
jgi:hypothetical protein